MKAVTLHQPWATFMALGVKRNETRSWWTSHRGPLAIHAGLSIGGWGRYGTRTRVGPYEVERDRSGLLLRGPTIWPYRLPLGAVVALVSVMDVKRTDDVHPDEVERELGDYTPGRFAWQTGALDVLRVPVSAVGHQGLWQWDPPAEVLERTRYYRGAR